MKINNIEIKLIKKSKILKKKYKYTTQWESNPRFPDIKQSVIRSDTLYQLSHFCIYHLSEYHTNTFAQCFMYLTGKSRRKAVFDHLK